MVGEVARGRVGEERVPDEQQEHRQQRQAEQRHQRGEELPRDVREAAHRRRQIQREHVVAPIGTEQLGAQDRREDRDIEPDLGQVLAVGDELREAVSEGLADDRADRQHREGGEEGDQRQRDREELGAPALARAEGAEGTPARKRDEREPRRPAHTVVARVADVLESSAHAIAPITASSSVRSPGSSARRLTSASVHGVAHRVGQDAGVAVHGEPAVVAILDPHAADAQCGAQRAEIADRADPRTAGLAPAQFADPALRGDAPVAQHDHGVACALHVLQHMRGEQHADPEVAREPPHEVQHLIAALRVEPVGGLVQHDELGRVDERLRKLDPLAHASRERPDQALALLLQADLEEHLARAQHGDAARQPAQLAEVHDQVACGHPAGQALVLGHVADAPAQLEAARCRVDAEQRAVPASGATSPSNARISVDLPAPLAPSRPIASSTSSTLTSSRATTSS